MPEPEHKASMSRGVGLATKDAQRSGSSVEAWDLPTRLFHWTLVGLVALAWVTSEFAEQLGDPVLKMHRWNGIAVLALVVWRLMWGFAGSPTARFTNFVRGPGMALSYLRGLLRGAHARYLGHNPAGAYMVLALLAVVGIEAVLGLFTVEHNDLTAGPLYRLLSEDAVKQASRLHRMMFDNVLMPFVVVHVGVNVLYALVKREPLIPAMITGRKPAADYADSATAAADGRPVLRALVLLAVSVVIVIGTIKLLGGRLP